jgi:hypothetical protein
MLEAREYEGVWWLPDAPDDGVTGTLYFSQEDIQLELMGAFNAAVSVPEPGQVVSFGSDFGRLPDQARITGVIRGDQYVSLERCTGFGVEAMLPARNEYDIRTTTYRPRFVLVGARYDMDEEVVFDEVSVRFSDLDTWVARSGFDPQVTYGESGVTSVTVTYTQLDPIEVRIDEDTKLKIEFPWSWSGHAQHMTESRIKQEASFRFCFGTPANIERALTYVTQLRGFVALAVGRPIRLLRVSGVHNNAEIELGPGAPPPGTSPSRKLAVELLYRLIGLPDEPKRPLYLGEMLFTLTDAEPRLEEILTTWFSQQEHLGPILVRYFHLVHTTPSSRESEFENLVRVLETHHRRTHGSAERDDEYVDRLDRILSAVEDEDDREWLEGQLEFSHEPKLRDRLRDVVERCPTISGKLVGSRTRIKSFIGRVAQTRNYETHLDPTNEAGALSGAKLVTAVYQLRCLVEMTLLLDIGFTCEQIDSMFGGMSDRYAEVAHMRDQSK